MVFLSKVKFLMKVWFFLLLVLCYSLSIQAQEVYVCDNNGSIHTLDLSDCSTSFVVDINSGLEPNDITFHPNGNLYAILNSGEISEIDIATGAFTTLTNLPGGDFNSLTCNEDGLFYATGGQGILWTYDLVTDVSENLGNFNFGASGDLTFFEGGLYVATSGDNIVQIDLDDLDNSAIFIDESVPGSIFGIVSFSEGCSDFNTFANASNGDIYLIDFENQLLDFKCNVNLLIFGGASTSEFLASAAPIVIDSINLVVPSCDMLGSIEITASGGTAPIEYSLNGGAFQLSGVFTNLSTGIYEIAIKDEVDCTVLDTIDFEIPGLPFFNEIVIDTPSCGVDTFNVEILATGDNLEYAIDGVTFQQDNIFIGLSEGVYPVAISDENNCTIFDTINLEIPALPTFDDILIETLDCGVDFNIEIVATGNDLMYAITDELFQSSNIFTNLNAGAYEVAIADENNCVVLDTINLEIPDLLTFDDILIETPDCGVGSFNIEVIATGNDLEYALNGGVSQTVNTFTGLDAGTYEVAVNDENNCTILDTVVLIEAVLPTIDSIVWNPPLCNSGLFEVSIFASGGIGALSYSTDDLNLGNVNLLTISSAGNYTAYVEDALGCEAEMDFVLIDPPSFTFGNILVEPAICNQNNGSALIELTEIVGATLPYQFSIDNGNTYQSDNFFDGLTVGEYELILKDANDCLYNTNFTIIDNEGFMIQVETTNASCEMANGSIIVIPQNETSQMTYSLDGGTPQNDNQFTNLAVGTYSIVAVDEQNCSKTIEAIIGEQESLIIDLTAAENADCGQENGLIQVEASFGNPPYQYALEDAVFQTSALFSNLASGTYNITVRDTIGCQAFLTNIAVLSNDCQVIVPDAFSPNGDGLNDVFLAIIPVGETATIETFNVYNRWGLLIHQANNFAGNTNGNWWDGTYKNKEQNLGVYLYYIKVVYSDGRDETFKGNVTLVR